MPLLVESAYLKDPSGALTVEQVNGASFQPYKGSLGMGFEQGAVWVRLTLAPATASPNGGATEAVLQVDPSTWNASIYSSRPAVNGLRKR